MTRGDSAPYKFTPEGDPLTEPNHRRRNDALLNAEENADIKAGLVWAVEGAMFWFANGMEEYTNDFSTSKDMRLPDSVNEAFATWRENDDKIGSWIDARLDQDTTELRPPERWPRQLKEGVPEGRQAEAASTFRSNFNQNARAKDLGFVALAKDRHTGINHSMWEPEEVALYGRSCTARTAPHRSSQCDQRSTIRMSNEKRPVGRPPRLTPEQCRELGRLHYEEGVSDQKLATRFQRGVGTIDRAHREIPS